VGLMRYRSSANQNDSGYIELSEFHALVDPFIPSDLSDSAFRADFQETSFFDKSSGTATFFYNAKNTRHQINRMDVITEKTDTYDKVKSLYIEKWHARGDSIGTEKLHWKPGRNFQLIRQVSVNSGEPQTELIKVVWDNRE
jgi:hypothetical protein